MTAPTFFADRIINVSLTGQLVRLEFATLSAPAKEGEAPAVTPSQTQVMPLESFLQSYGMFEALIKRLVADGVLKPQQPGAASETEASVQ